MNDQKVASESDRQFRSAAQASSDDYALLRLAGLGLIYLFYQGFIELTEIGGSSGSFFSGFSVKWFAAMATYTVVAAAGLLLSAAAVVQPGRLVAFLNKAIDREMPNIARWAIAGSLIVLPSVVLLGEWGKHLTTPAFRFLLLSLSGIGAGLILSTDAERSLPRVLMGILATASAFVVAERFVAITGYPFKLYWSEGNRLWDYSLYFARNRYDFAGEFTFPSYLAIGRHGLWGLPFLVPGADILFIRFWDALLWLAPPFVLGWLLASPRRISISPIQRFGFGLWSLLFFTQGGVFAPLILSVSLLVWLLDARRVRSAIALAVISSFYAGISRWTWLFAPAILAGLWMLLDVISEPDRRRRFRNAFFVGLAGGLGGLASQALAEIFFPQPDPVFSTSLSQPLLWYRLLPNATNEQGILLGALIAVGPLIALLVWLGANRRAGWSPLEQIGLVSALGAFLIVGVVASVKIGGGSNLHNLDMFIVALMLSVALATMMTLHNRDLEFSLLPIAVRGIIVAIVLIPGFDAVRSGGPLILPSNRTVDESLSTIRREVEAAAESGEVLFIDQRQLLTFGFVESIPLVTDYELKDMMNRAMSSDAAYFNSFRDDLASHRFALIVSDPLPGFVQRSAYEFGEENDAWLKFVGEPLKRYYVQKHNLTDVGVRLLVPRTDGD